MEPKWSSVGKTKPVGKEWISGIVWDIGPLLADGFHRRWELERESAGRVETAENDIEDSLVACSEVPDQCGALAGDLRNDGGTVEEDVDDRRHAREDPEDPFLLITLEV